LHADFKLAHGDIRAFAPYLKLVTALDRYHGLDGRLPPPHAAQTGNALTAPLPPLASPTPPSLPSCRSRRKLHNSAPKTLKSLARLSTLQVWPDQMESRLSPSPTPSRPSRRSRQKLHNPAPKTLKSLARLSTSSGGSGEPETRRHEPRSGVRRRRGFSSMRH